ncbi:MAG: hypothetical protein RNU03_03500 [Candidatus Sedimenticola sp. (ex Thyasira tokunagai)]
MSTSNSNQQQRSLKKRLVLQVAGFVAIAMTLVTVLAALLFSGGLSDQVNELLKNATRSSQMLLEQRIAYLVENTERLTENPFVINGLQACRYLVKDFGTSKSPKSTRLRDSRYAPTVLRTSRFRIAHCSKAACALLHHDSRNDSTAFRMHSLYALHRSLPVAIPAIQPRLRLSGTNRLGFQPSMAISGRS